MIKLDREITIVDCGWLIVIILLLGIAIPLVVDNLVESDIKECFSYDPDYAPKWCDQLYLEHPNKLRELQNDVE